MLRESGPVEGYHDLYSFNYPTLVLYSPETRNIFSEKKKCIVFCKIRCGRDLALFLLLLAVMDQIRIFVAKRDML